MNKGQVEGKSIPLAIGALLVFGGIYVIVIALSPQLIPLTTNPTDNSTTKLLQSTEQNLTEQRLYIPKLDVNVSYDTGDKSALERGAWWRQPQNGNPRDGGNFVLSAHRFIMGLTPKQTLRKSPFYNIDKLKVGDEIIVDYQGKRYSYQISQVFAVTPDAIEIEKRTDQPQLTLYSCTLGGSADGREVIIATPKSS
ncbi:hypothetical protein B7Y94_04390 [Candidatus Saccharibacteria bacterium 32-49-12]|nr:MAG: hypothetical protein B7Y94_04390 [Candidatus Saccharibacteria bacterium 32-49-12]